MVSIKITRMTQFRTLPAFMRNLDPNQLLSVEWFHDFVFVGVVLSTTGVMTTS